MVHLATNLWLSSSHFRQQVFVRAERTRQAAPKYATTASLMRTCKLYVAYTKSLRFFDRKLSGVLYSTSTAEAVESEEIKTALRLDKVRDNKL